jgi:hypothetical protein
MISKQEIKAGDVMPQLKAAFGSDSRQGRETSPIIWVIPDYYSAAGFEDW